MEVKNNAAARLYEVLSRLKANSPNLSLQDAWKSALDCQSAPAGVFLRCIADMHQLAADAKREIEALKNVDHAIYLEPFPKIERLLGSTSFHGPLKDSMGGLGDSSMTALRFGVDAVSRDRKSTEIDSAQLKMFSDLIDELLESAIDSGLPEHLKELFLSNLQEMRHALFAFRITGVDGLEFEVDRVIGSIYRHQNEIKAVPAESTAGKWLQKFFEMVDQFNQTVTAAQNMTALAPAGMALLALMQ